MIRSAVVFALFSILLSCRPSFDEQVADVCRQMDEVCSEHKRMERIDSLIGLTGALPPNEQLAVLYHAVANLRMSEIKGNQGVVPLIDSCLKKISVLPYPVSLHKNTAFILLSAFNEIGSGLYKTNSILSDVNRIAPFLFELESRLALTPEERCNFLCLKAKIYSNVFREYESTLQFYKEAEEIACNNDLSAKTMQKIYAMQVESYWQLGGQDSLILIARRFLSNIEKKQGAPEILDFFRRHLMLLSLNVKDYRQAYYWYHKVGDTGINFVDVVDIYIGLDSIPQALDYLGKVRKQIHPALLGTVAWKKACVYQAMGDSTAYLASLKECISLFDSLRMVHSAISEVNWYDPSVAYAQMLWKQGKRKQAIMRMEIVSSDFLERKDFFGTEVPVHINNAGKILDKLRLLQRYYNAEKRVSAGSRMEAVCDSLQLLFDTNTKKAEYNRQTYRMYAIELFRNLRIKTENLESSKHRLYIISGILGVTLLLFGLFIIYYFQRKKQLDSLYIQQKKLEDLQVEQLHLVSASSGDVPADEVLFRELEKRFYKEQLFRNPDFSRDDLCRLGGSNRTYVSACINKYAGTNINQWLNKARIDYAIKLIHDGETNLMIIAEVSGFSSTTSFFRNFKQFTRLTPKQYIHREQAVL